MEILSCKELNLLRIRSERYLKLKVNLDLLEFFWDKHINSFTPIQYLSGFCFWRDLKLEVSNKVLIPRPETELLIEFVLEKFKDVYENITFADLLINSNYKFFREKIIPLICNYKDVYLIANFRAKPIDILKKSKHIKIPDNFFDNYQQIRDEVIEKLLDIPKGSLILSSASSLSNIVGYKIFQLRKDITFLDVGTSINDLLSLDKITRSYHVTYFSKGLKPFLRKLRPSFYIRW